MARVFKPIGSFIFMQEILLFQNKHWQGALEEYPHKREVYESLEKQLSSNKLILSIEGPRRVGKSILMKQLISFLIKSKTDPKDVLYFSFDSFKEDIFKLIKEYEIIRKKPITTGKIYFFFDEIQKVYDWQSKIKLIYDNYPNIKIIVSGSTLRSSKKESLAGRIFEYFIKPLSFKEFLVFSNNSNLLDSNIDSLFVDKYRIYLTRQFPDLAINSSLSSSDYVTTIIKKVIYEDSLLYLPDVDVDLLLSVFKIILKDPGQIINYNDLAKDLGCGRKTVSKYMDFLIGSSLVRKIYNFSNNSRKEEKKAKKFYPFCTTLISFVSKTVLESKIIETDVAFQLNAEYFWDNRRVNEIDFILLNSSEKKTGVEVKYRNQISLDDLNNFKLKQVLKLKLDKRYLITKEDFTIDFDTKKENVNVLPYYLVWRDFK